jgi:iron complex outermembrane receptor protein
MKTFTIKILHILSLIIAGTAITFAQTAKFTGCISGSLFDENGKPMDYATVSLLDSQDSSIVKETLSNEQGVYNFDHINTGTYLIKVTMVGYGMIITKAFTVTENQSNITVPVLKMSPGNHVLSTVNIAGSKPLVEHNGDKTVINVEGSVLSAGNSAMDILERTPGVIIDKDDNISLNGRQGVSVMVNGKLTYLTPAQLATLLRSTDGNTIKSIEIITNPSAKYDASGNAGIINIELKKGIREGTNGSIVAGAGYGKYGKDNETISLNHKQGNLNLFGSFSHLDDKHDINVNLRRIVVDSANTTYFNQYSSSVKQDNNNSYRLGADYDLSPKNRIGALISGYFNGENDDDSDNTYIGPDFSRADSSLHTSAADHQTFHNISFNLNDTYKIDTAGQELSADLDHSKFLNNANAGYATDFFLPNGSILHPGSFLGNGAPSTIGIRTAKTDYLNSITKSLKLETGLKFSDVKTDNDLLQTTDASMPYINENHFIYDEKIGAGYISLSKDYSDYSIKAGLRAEYTRSNSTADSVNILQYHSNHYLDLFPSLFISHKIDDKNEVNVSYGRRIDRPQYDNLNPFTYHFDPYTYLQGNPYLRPQYASNFQFNYTYDHNITLTLGYTHLKDMIANVPVTDPAAKIAYAIPENLQSQNSLSMNVFASYTLAKWWEGNINMNGVYNDVMSDRLNGVGYSANKATLIVRVTETFTPVKGFKAEITSAYQSPVIFGVFNLSAQHWTDAGISHSFADKSLNVKLSVSDVFNTHHFVNTVIFGSDNLVARVNAETQVAHLTLTYNFGNGKIKSSEHQTGAEDTKGRVKGAN